MRSKKGITLVALVVTIIVLLVLAGVTISMVLGDNGLVKKAQLAKERTEQSNRQEQDRLGKLIGSVAASVNAPVLKEGMIPVKWNGTSWEKADSSNSGNEWYDYSSNSKKWANVVTVSETNREKYKNASIGSADAIIAEEDITTMFVWIPRYSYKIKYYEDNRYTTLSKNNAKTRYGEMEIKFLEGKSDKYREEEGEAVRSNTANKEYVVHPAFTSDISLGGMGEELEGFWMGKFEASNSTSPRNNEGFTNDSLPEQLHGGGNDTSLKATIRPSVTSWRGIDVNSIYQVCRAMNEAGNIHGLTENTKTMLIKNSQWGAVAYLAQSDYGNKQTANPDSGIWNNVYNEGFTFWANNSYGIWNRGTTLTGVSGASRDNYSNYYAKVKNKKDNQDSISITYIKINPDGTEGEEYTNTYYHYHTNNGQKASTTRNIYGVYDMSGGAMEYTSSYLESGSNGYTDNFNTNVEEKYKMKYQGEGEEDKTVNWEANKNIYGDAIYETSINASGNNSWSGKESNFLKTSSPFMARGGFFGDFSQNGLFAFSNNLGTMGTYYGFRICAI